MKLIRKKIRLIALVMAFLVLFVSCEQYDTIENHIEYTGEEIFKSIFFSIGESLELSTLNSQREFVHGLEESQVLSYEGNINTLIETIKENSPMFFELFKKDIISQNHYNIEKGLNDAASAMQVGVSKMIPNFQEVLAQVKKEIVNDKSIKSDKKESSYSILTEYESLLDENMLSIAGCSFIFACAIFIFLYAGVIIHNHAAVSGGVVLYYAYWGANLEKVKKDDDPYILTGIMPNMHYHIGEIPIEKLELKKEMLVDELATRVW